MLKPFEQKNNALAAIFMGIAAIAWSLFGVISTLASEVLVPVILFAAFGNLFALILGVITSKIAKIQLTETIKFFIANPKIKKYLAWHSLLNLNHILFVGGYFLLENKIIGVVTAETVPVFMILASYIFFKDDYKKDKHKFYTWILLIFALMGVVLLALTDPKINITELQNFSTLGMILMLLGAITGGINSVVGNKLLAIIKDNNKHEKITTIAIKTQFVSRLSTMILYLVVCAFAYSFNLLDISDLSHLLNENVITLALLFGLLTGYIQVIFTRIAGNIATNHNIYSVWFLAPIIGSFSLWFFGYGEINPTIVMAFILILVPVILLNLNKK